ncbi:DUF397 domain-containing protein [Actinomadura sp. 21ATH]|uniref:DUF397 domain-containing protein n=1 Tax=Actinomadura sp. 21ATH TaxID=1735444 RepID=UPI0035C1F669
MPQHEEPAGERGIRLTWRRSSYSTSGENCVEVAALLDHLGVRDSKDPDGPKLVFSAMAWQNFRSQVKAGAYDRT